LRECWGGTPARAKRSPPTEDFYLGSLAFALLPLADFLRKTGPTSLETAAEPVQYL